jgi:hypothetical protein
MVNSDRRSFTVRVIGYRFTVNRKRGIFMGQDSESFVDCGVEDVLLDVDASNGLVLARGT